MVKYSKDTDKQKDTATTKIKSKKKISKCTIQSKKLVFKSIYVNFY